MTPQEFCDDHETTFAGLPAPQVDPSDVTVMSGERLLRRAITGVHGAVRARKGVSRRLHANLRLDVRGRG